jgi:hypothetical protein
MQSFPLRALRTVGPRAGAISPTIDRALVIWTRKVATLSEAPRRLDLALIPVASKLE